MLDLRGMDPDPCECGCRWKMHVRQSSQVKRGGLFVVDNT